MPAPHAIEDDCIVFINDAVQFFEKLHVTLSLHGNTAGVDGLTFHAAGDFQFGVEHPDLLFAPCQAYRHAGPASHGQDLIKVFDHGADLFKGLSFRNNHFTFLLFTMAWGRYHEG
jgi:hypothetical protein